MTRAELIAANDRLRTCCSGGHVEVCHGPYELDDRTMGRMLCVIAQYHNFASDSLHDEGLMVVAASASRGPLKSSTASASCASGLPSGILLRDNSGILYFNSRNYQCFRSALEARRHAYPNHNPSQRVLLRAEVD
jgi:hypothetical protein